MTLVCPNCENEKVLVYEETAFYVNTGEFFCHSIKAHDSDANAQCPYCGWTGERKDLKEMK
jgi:ssDNA-binding Zn-finger/Zn-ribbon topoisomerase 1